MTVRPGTRTAHSSAFSVAVTEASSSNTSAPVSSFASSPKPVRSAASVAPNFCSASQCVSVRRRPMTSPPGGPRVTFLNRASIGPANRSEVRISRESFGSIAVFFTFAAQIFTECSSSHSTLAPSSPTISSIPFTSRIRGKFRRMNGSAVSRLAAMSGNAEFLLPFAVISPRSGVPPSTMKRPIAA